MSTGSAAFAPFIAGGEGGGEEESAVTLVDRERGSGSGRGNGWVTDRLRRGREYATTKGCIPWLRWIMARRVSGGERGNHRDIRSGRAERESGKKTPDKRAASQLMATLLDPTSREYKRARKHHYKSTKNRAQGVDKDWTPFRAAEKKYKARFPPPDLSDVLDLAFLDKARSSEIERGGWKGHPETAQAEEIGLEDTRATAARTRKAFKITAVPGA